MLPHSPRQHPNFKKERKIPRQFFKFFSQVRALHRSSQKKVPHRRRRKRSVMQEESCCFAHKTNRFKRSHFLCRRGLTFHLWWDWGQVYCKNNNNKTFAKEAIVQCTHSFRLNIVYWSNYTPAKTTKTSLKFTQFQTPLPQFQCFQFVKIWRNVHKDCIETQRIEKQNCCRMFKFSTENVWN